MLEKHLKQLFSVKEIQPKNTLKQKECKLRIFLCFFLLSVFYFSLELFPNHHLLFFFFKFTDHMTEF